MNYYYMILSGIIIDINTKTTIDKLISYIINFYKYKFYNVPIQLSNLFEWFLIVWLKSTILCLL